MLFFTYFSTGENRRAVIAAARRFLSTSGSWIKASIVLHKAGVIAFLLLFANPGSSAQTSKIAGSGAAVGAMTLLAAEFSKKEPKAIFAPIEALGSGGSIRAAVSGALDLAVISRPLSDAERNTGAQAIEYARTPFVIVVNAKVPVKALTHAQLADFLDGKSERWPNGQRIRFILRPAGDIDTKRLMELSPGVSSAMQRALQRPGMMIAGTDREAAELIEKTPGAVGASTLASILTDSRSIVAVTLEGAVPSVKALASGAYPLHKQLFVVWGKTEPSPTVRRFVAFLATPPAKSILERTGHLLPPFTGK